MYIWVNTRNQFRQFTIRRQETKLTKDGFWELTVSPRTSLLVVQTLCSCSHYTELSCTWYNKSPTTTRNSIWKTIGDEL